MKYIALILLLGLTGLHAQDRTAWYREAKFGMFIHWGPYSLASVEASWPIMTPQKTGPQAISEDEYRALPARFNPVKFDPREWVKLAKAAGQRYMVITTKHHDGFAMFDSAYTKYKITQTPYGKDIIKELADAAKAGGMPLGFYYSPPDMDHPGFRDTSKLSAANWQGEPWRPEWPLYLGYMELQLRELLTRYGDVAIIWFDGLGHQEKYDGYRFHKLIHEMQPKTLINNRIGLPGDYDTPEQFVPKVTPTRKGALYRGTEVPQEAAAGAPPAPEDFRLWETCMTINNQWGYNRNDHNFKSAGKLIQTLVDVASKGGNLLLNVGPHAGRRDPAGVPGAPPDYGSLAQGERRVDLRHHLRPAAEPGFRQDNRQGQDGLPARVRLAEGRHSRDERTSTARRAGHSVGRRYQGGFRAARRHAHAETAGPVAGCQRERHRATNTLTLPHAFAAR